MHINLGNFSNFKKNFLNYEIGNLCRLIFKNSYPQLGDEFKFIDQKSKGESFEPYYKKNILPHVKLFEYKRTKALKSVCMLDKQFGFTTGRLREVFVDKRLNKFVT